MAHEIEGNKAFFVTEPAWHGLGTVLENSPTLEEGIAIAYPHQLFKLDLQAKIDDQIMDLANSKVIMRDDGKEYNTVGSDFELLQPQEAFKPFKNLIDSDLVSLEAGGSLRGGSQAWLLAKIKSAESEIVKGDLIKSYFLIATGFDGSLRLLMSQTNTRVVCANTLASAQSEGIDYRFKHTKNIRTRMNNAEDQVKSALEAFRKDTEAYKHLASKKVTQSDQIDYIGKVLLTKEEINDADQISTKKKTIVQNVIELLDTQKGIDYVPAIRGTAWQAYNAISQYITHDYGRSNDSRLNAQWFGESAKINDKALELALTM